MVNPPLQQAHEKLAAELASINRRIRIIEEQIASVRSHIDMLDNSLIEKHKSSTEDIRNVEASFREIQSEIKENKELIERVVNKLSEYASKENVKVLEKYINFWNPLHYVTKQEVVDLIKEKKLT